MLSRYHQQKEAPKYLANGDNLIADYTFEKDAIFAGINLENDELDVYNNVHEALAEKIPSPDLIIYLRASTDVLMQRIALRDRSYERNMSRDYIDQLNQAYEKFFGEAHQGSRILMINTNDLNYVASEEDLKWVENRIRQRLKLTPYQEQLLLEIEIDG